MNMKFIFSYSILLAMQFNYITPMDSQHDDNDNDFEIIKRTDAPDKIFDLIAEGNPTTVDLYLQQNPAAINARKPYTTEKRSAMSFYPKTQKVTVIQDGYLPLHAALAKKDIPCVQSVLRHIHADNLQNTQDYHRTIQTELNLHENNICYQECESWIYLALQLDPQNNDIFHKIMAISSKKEINECLQDCFSGLADTRKNTSEQREKFEYYKNELLNKGAADVNYKNESGETILYNFIVRDYAKPAQAEKLILKDRADINIKYGDNENTLIHEAMQNGSWTMAKDSAIQVLLKNGLSINAKNKHNQTPAHVAFKRGSMLYGGCVLARAGADMTCQDSYGKTPYDYFQDAIQDQSITSVYDTTDLTNRECTNKKTLEKEAKALKLEITDIYNKQKKAQATLSKFAKNYCIPQYRKKK